MYPHERSLVEKFAGKPFAIIGVNSDKDLDKLKPRLAEEKITWRSYWNGTSGTNGGIAARFGVRGWPTIYILDAKGVIRFMNQRGEAMNKAVDELLAEMEKTKPAK